MYNNTKVIDIAFIDLVIELAKDIGVSGEDVEYVINRYKNEGLRFLTFTLPSLSKAVIHSLETGVFERPTAFAWKGKSLFFMNSFLSKIFDKAGMVLPEACPYALRGIRQFCEYFYKLALETSDEEKIAGESKYVENEEIVKSFEICDAWCESLRKNLETYYPKFSRTPVQEVFSTHLPRFGPGAFGSSRIVDSREESHTVYKRLSSNVIGTAYKGFKPFSGYFKSYPSSPERITLVDESKVSVVTFVAKDARGPRVISMEPLHHLRAQMSYLDWAISALQDDTGGCIQFVDQSRNKQQAKIASVDRSRATLDLKDASDRVSFKLMSRIFRNTFAPAFFLKNARSTHTRLPSGKVIPLYKVAGMGSGLTFPTMSLLIHLSICTRVSARFGLPYKQVMRSVSVYGDDVIVPTCWYNVAISALMQSGLLVNKDKSFFRGFFRESCGGDYYRGVNVTPVKLKLDKVGLRSACDYKHVLRLDNDRQVYKLNAHTRELYHSNMINLKKYYDVLLRRGLRFYPKVSGTSPLVGEYCDVPFVRDSLPVLAYSLVPRRQENTQLCPYKYLGQRFNKVDAPTYDIFKDMIKQTGLSSEEYITPQDMRIVLKRHSGIRLY